jgi:peptidyl-dipeptidase A
MRRIVIMLVIAGFGLLSGCSSGPPKEEQALSRFITAHLEQVEPLYSELTHTYWNACLTGEDEAYAKYADLELKLRTIYSNREEFATLKQWKESGKVTDPLLARQLDILHDGYLGNQIDTTLIRQMVELSTAIENKFNTFRGTMNGKEVSSNDILGVLRTEKKSSKRKAAWEAAKQVGEVVSPELLQLVKLRNKAARQLGFPNYYVMQLTLSEQDPDELLALFDELKALTDEPFKAIKADIDQVLSKRYGIKPKDMRPWHYQDPFFQESPKIYEVDLDQYYDRLDIKEIATCFFQGIGLDPTAILNRSDLYEAEKKYPHAYSIDMDRKGDCRIMTNLRNDEYWMDTLLHELGHATYSDKVDTGLPWLLRTEAHTFTTEAIAMFFGRQARNAEWMEKVGAITAEERKTVEPITRKASRLSQMVFARWCQVMVRFERALYEDPDQDLNALWWQLVEENQYVHPPEGRNKPDWAAKIHLTSSAVYYHNYMLGELLASQLTAYVMNHIVDLPEGQAYSPCDHPEVGQYLDQKVFKPAARYRWDEMITRATGEPLTAKYFVDEFVSM